MDGMDPRDLGLPERLLKLKRELWRGECRRDLVSFAVQALPNHERPAKHHRLICAKLAAMVAGDYDRLLIIAPPGSAKTTYVSRLFPAHYYATHPRAHIIGASHTMELAATNSGHVQRTIRDNAQTLGYALANDNRTHWFTSTGAEYLAAGTGGVIRGFRADVVIVDDPIKSRQEAESETERDALWQWYKSDLLPRLTPRGRIVLIGTAYHEDDLLARIQRIEGAAWHVLRLPAISEGADIDPLHRPEGEPLWNDDAVYGYGQKLLLLQAAAEREGALRDWYSQYQGSPRAAEGNMFRPDRMPVFDFIPPGVRIIDQVRGWDLAASSGKGDWTATVKLALLHGDPRYDEMMVITDVQRMRGTPDEVRHMIRTVAAADGHATVQWFPEDPGQAGKAQAEDIVKMLSGHRVKTERMTGSKEVRADPAASQANIGRIGLLAASWNAMLLDELASFPSGRFDDMVDALSLAFAKLDANGLGVWLRM
jgi:predicted phage terminase large subunit-like protein